jgi:hypothetical protein
MLPFFARALLAALAGILDLYGIALSTILTWVELERRHNLWGGLFTAAFGLYLIYTAYLVFWRFSRRAVNHMAVAWTGIALSIASNEAARAWFEGNHERATFAAILFAVAVLGTLLAQKYLKGLLFKKAAVAANPDSSVLKLLNLKRSEAKARARDQRVVKR